MNDNFASNDTIIKYDGKLEWEIINENYKIWRDPRDRSPDLTLLLQQQKSWLPYLIFERVDVEALIPVLQKFLKTLEEEE